MRLWSERTGVSAKNAASVQGPSSYHLTLFDDYHQHDCFLGPRKFKAPYNEALSLEQKTTSDLNTLLEQLLSWVTVTNGHGPPGDPLPDAIALEQLREQWVKAKDFLSATLVILEDGQVPELFDRSAPLVSTKPRLGSMIKRWMMNLVRF